MAGQTVVNIPEYEFVDRVTPEIERLERVTRKAGLSSQDFALLHDVLTMDVSEHDRFRKSVSLGYCTGRLSADETRLIFQLVGSIPDVFNQESLGVKMVFWKLFRQLEAEQRQ